MIEKKFAERSFPELSVFLERVYDYSGSELFRLVVLHLSDCPHYERLFTTYNGAIIALFRLLSNNMAAV